MPIGVDLDLQFYQHSILHVQGSFHKRRTRKARKLKQNCAGVTAGAIACAGLTTEEEEEGKRAKAALEEGDGDGAADDEDGEDGDYKKRGKFFTHLKKNEVRLLHVILQFDLGVADITLLFLFLLHARQEA